MKRRLPILLLLVFCLGLLTPALAYDSTDTAGRHILSGYYHSAAVDADGTLWMWGHNGQGQLGIGEAGNATTDSGLSIQTVPVQVMDNAVAVSCGGYHTAAIDTDGALWTWGQNSSGQLGNGGTGNAVNQKGSPIQNVPAKLLDNMVAVSCGGFHTAAIDADGALWTWGSNKQGQLGTGDDAETVDTPVKVMDNVEAVSCGQEFTAAIDTDGNLWTWGNNTLGQLGNGGTNSVSTPVKVMENAAAVICGGYHTAALDADGNLWTWGSNEYGELGNQVHGIETAPVKVMEHVTAVSCGQSHTAAIDENHALWIWGANDRGQLGNEGLGNATSMAGPVQTTPLKVLDRVSAVACGEYHTLVIQDDGTVWTWGSNDCGQLGDGSQNSATSPVLLQKLTLTLGAPSSGANRPAQGDGDSATTTPGAGAPGAGAPGNDAPGTGTALILLVAVIVLLAVGAAAVLLRRKKAAKGK